MGLQSLPALLACTHSVQSLALFWRRPWRGSIALLAACCCSDWPSGCAAGHLLQAVVLLLLRLAGSAFQ